MDAEERNQYDKLWSENVSLRQRLEEAGRLFGGSPKDRLDYCGRNGLMPPIGEDGRYPLEACVDEYWQKAIARHLLASLPPSESE